MLSVRMLHGVMGHDLETQIGGKVGGGGIDCAMGGHQRDWGLLISAGTWGARNLTENFPLCDCSSQAASWTPWVSFSPSMSLQRRSTQSSTRTQLVTRTK